MLTVLLMVLIPVVIVVAAKKRGQRKTMLRTPLAGFDTGCRFGTRTPGRFFRPHRGF